MLRKATEALSLRRPARILDVGCGGGANLEVLARFGSVTGVEPAGHAREVALRRGVGAVVEGQLPALPFEAGSFDLVTAFDVVEHVDDEVRSLRELDRVVQRNGVVMVTVPAYPRLFGPHDVVNEHRRRYTRKTLLNAAGAAGLEPRLVTHFNAFLLLPLAAYRLGQRRWGHAGHTHRSDFERTPGRLNRALVLPLRAEAVLIGKGVRLPAGLSILAAFSPRNASRQPLLSGG